MSEQIVEGDIVVRKTHKFHGEKVDVVMRFPEGMSVREICQKAESTLFGSAYAEMDKIMREQYGETGFDELTEDTERFQAALAENGWDQEIEVNAQDPKQSVHSVDEMLAGLTPEQKERARELLANG